MKKNNLLQMISYLIIIDILFMPYFPYLVMPYSLPLVLITLIFLINKIIIDELIKSFIIIIITVLLSTLISIYINTPPEYIIENFKRAFQFLSTFAYFLYFRIIFKEYNLNLKPLFLIFSIYILLLLGLFIYDPYKYLDFRNTIYPITASDIGEFMFFLRFDYMFADPNTAAYFILLALFFSFIKLNFNIYINVLLMVVILLTIISTKSIGATLCVFLFIGFFSIRLFKHTENRLKVKKLLVVCLLIIIIATLSHLNLDTQKVFTAIDNYIERIQIAEESSEGRINRYLNITKEFYPSILGRGYTLISEENIIKPHNDHLRLIYSYGIICYILVIYFFYKKLFTNQAIILLPAFIAFSFNTLIDEQKFLALFLIILSFLYIKDKKKFSCQK